jgi:O-antigen/teichoic acid export membrane protein
MNNSINLLKTNKLFMKFFKNTSWLFLEKIIKTGFSFYVLTKVVTYLGPTSFGLISYSQSIIAILAVFSSLGLELILVKELSLKKFDKNELLGTAFILKFAASIISILLIYFNIFQFEDSEIRNLTLIIVFTLIFQNFNLIDVFFQANVISKFAVISNLIVSIFSSIIKLSLVYYEMSLVFFAYSIVFDSLMMAIGYVYIYKQKKQFITYWKFSKKIAKYLTKKSSYLILISFSVIIYTKTDQLMIGYLSNIDEVGSYSAAFRFVEIFYLIPILINQSLFPGLVKAQLKSKKEYFRFIGITYKISFWAVFPFVVFIILFSEKIVEILYGVNFQKSSIILSVLASTIILNSFGNVTTKILYIHNLEKNYLLRSLIGAILNIILNFIFISRFGALGASISTLITLFSINFIYDLFDSDLRKFYLFKIISVSPFFKIN